MKWVVMAEESGGDTAGSGGSAAEAGGVAGGLAGASETPGRDASGRFVAAAPAEDVSPLAWYAGADPGNVTETAKQHKTLDSFLRHTKEMDGLLGRSIQIPQKSIEEDPAAWNRYFARFGRPADPNSYEIEWQDLPEGQGWDTEWQRQFFETAHASGQAPWQAKMWADFAARMVHDATNRQQGEAAEREAQLRRELYTQLGASTPRVLEDARHSMELLGNGQYGNDGIAAWEAIQAAGLDKNVPFVRAMANMFRRLGEGEFYSNDTAPAGPSTIESMRDQARTLNRKTHRTPAEEAELRRLYDRLAPMEERRRGRALVGSEEI